MTEVKKIPLKDLVFDRLNANKGTERGRYALEKSLEKFGAGRSLLLDAKGRLIAGNKTAGVAGEMGFDDVIVVQTTGNQLVAVQRTDLDLEDDAIARELAVSDNRTGELSLSWDSEVLQELMDGGVDLSDFFKDDELDALINAIASEPLLNEEEDEENTADLIDKAESGQIESRVKLGDLWACGRHRVCCGDSTDEGVIKALLGDRICDICFTSPPYNLGSSVGLRNGSFKGKTNAYKDTDDGLSSEDYASFLSRFLTNSFAASKWQFVNIQMLADNKRSLLRWLGDFSEHVADIFIWNKTNPQPAMAERVSNSAFEFVIAFSSEKQPTRAIAPASFNRGCFSNVFTSAVGSNSHTNGMHGATFSVEFAEHYIKNLSQPNHHIFEPFLGSGTTMIAAQKMEGDRTVYGCELSEQYCELILRRFEAFTGQVAQFVGRVDQ